MIFKVLIGFTAAEFAAGLVASKSLLRSVVIAGLAIGYFYYFFRFEAYREWIASCLVGVLIGCIAGVRARSTDFEKRGDGIMLLTLMYAAVGFLHPFIVFDEWPGRVVRLVGGAIRTPVFLFLVACAFSLIGYLISKPRRLRWLEPIGLLLYIVCFVDADAACPIAIAFLIGWLSPNEGFHWFIDFFCEGLDARQIPTVLLGIAMLFVVTWTVWLREGSGPHAMAIEVTPIYFYCGLLVRAVGRQRLYQLRPVSTEIAGDGEIVGETSDARAVTPDPANG